jgi:hypothetical protein
MDASGYPHATAALSPGNNSSGWAPNFVRPLWIMVFIFMGMKLNSRIQFVK